MRNFDPYAHKEPLLALIESVREAEGMDSRLWSRLARQHTQSDGGMFSKSKVIYAYRVFARDGVIAADDEDAFIAKVRLKPVRTLSGVTPVTVLTKPAHCPGRCIFCPEDVCMPKSYIRDEPGAQRAAAHRFDPYAQTESRLRTYWEIGHPVDKVEMIVLGGTWSAYDAGYRRWFIKRLFDAMNAFDPVLRPPRLHKGGLTVRDDIEAVQGDSIGWDAVKAAQRANESAPARCVGLVIETRPDSVTPEEVANIRRLGCTKVQIGVQSLDDEVLALNKRGHDVAATREAFRLLRGAGFKIHAHWMPNLYGSSPEKDIADFGRLFEDADFRPDELKIYPCSLLPGTELMDLYERGKWRPYTHEELNEVLVACLRQVPAYCRVTRVVRDIPSHHIVDGNTKLNFREIALESLRARGLHTGDIRAREIRGGEVESVQLEEIAYATSIGEEVFLQFVTPDDRIAGFLRLALPECEGPIDELGRDAVIREVHVYGQAVAIGEDAGGAAQHAGLGTRLIERAKAIAAARGYGRLHVISAVGTRAYYRKLGFIDGILYQRLE